MDNHALESNIKEKLRPHTEKVRSGTFTEHDVLPALFDLILSNQTTLHQAVASMLEQSETNQKIGSDNQAELQRTMQTIADNLAANHSQAINALNDSIHSKLLKILLTVASLSFISSLATITLLLLR